MPPPQIRPRRPDDDPHIVKISDCIYAEFPPETVEDYRHQVATTPEGTRVLREVAEVEGTIVGVIHLIQKFWTDQATSYYGNVEVDSEQWGHGIGRALYDRLVESAREFGAERLFGNFLERIEQSEQFLTHRGFEPTGRANRMSRLNVHRADLEGYDGVEQGLQGLRIATLMEIGFDDESFLKDLYELDLEATRDIPSSEPFVSVPFDTWLKDVRESPSGSPETFWIALDGKKPVGLAHLSRHMNTAWNGFTGTARAYRGRGVARALKLRTIDWARANGVDWIYTGNDVDNKRMLDVNIRLGYQPLPKFVEVVKNLNG